MSRTGQKRANGTEIPKSSQKRRKLQGPLKQRIETKPSAAFSANELSWREVTPPERLDDAEGFLGLEEIDDVEVIRDAQGKQTRFRTFTRTGRRPPSTATLSYLENSTPQSQDDDEWSGFKDDEQVESDAAKSQTKANVSNGVDSRKMSGKTSSLDRFSSDTPYSILAGRDEETAADVSQWSGLALSRETLSAIAVLGFPHPTPIQTAVIPDILAGHDVIGKAVTGSGKTLAFAIPIFQRWLATNGSGHLPNSERQMLPTSLVLTPTRELAHQLSKHFQDLVENAGNQPKVATVTGGLSIHKQQRQLVGADIIIGTPGRLCEVMKGSQDLIDGLKQIKFLVIDEADRLLSDGHFPELEEILNMLDRRVIGEQVVSRADEPDPKTIGRQTLIFSATFHKGLQSKLAGKSHNRGNELLTNRQSMDYLLQKINFREKRPKFIDVNPTSQMAQRLKEGIVECSAMEKDIYLYSILTQKPRSKTLVFTNSISSVRRLTPLLQNLNLPALPLHSSMPQKARLRSVERFSEPKTGGSVLIATDVAARGLDIQNIDLILHYHVPRTADMYIHRSGRTARAENAGESILVCSPDEVAGVIKLVAKIHGVAGGVEPVQIDRQLVARLLPRMTLSQKITEATLAKEKLGSQDEWLKAAAEELGVDYDSDEFAATGAKSSRGRGSGRREQQKSAGAVPRAEVAKWRAQLKDLLSKHVNLGVSERYLAGGVVDVDALLDARERSQFLDGRRPGG